MQVGDGGNVGDRGVVSSPASSSSSSFVVGAAAGDGAQQRAVDEISLPGRDSAGSAQSRS